MKQAVMVDDRIVYRVPFTKIVEAAHTQLMIGNVIPKDQQLPEGYIWTYAVRWEDEENREGLFIEFFVRGADETIDVSTEIKEEEGRHRRILLGRRTILPAEDE